MVETRNQKELKGDQDIVFDEVTSMDMTKAKGDGAARWDSSHKGKGKASTKSRGVNLGDSGAAAAAMIADNDGIPRWIAEI